MANAPAANKASNSRQGQQAQMQETDPVEMGRDMVEYFANTLANPETSGPVVPGHRLRAA